MTRSAQNVLIIGGRGKIAKLATTMLVEANSSVTSLVRNQDSVPEVEELGATALVRDLTEVGHEEWKEILGQFDVVVWSAGNGGRGGADVTYAVDRDGAIAVINALTELELPPRFIMVSYLGSLENEVEDDGGTWYAYVESKKAADKRLLETDLEFLILAPAVLTDEPAAGIKIIENTQGRVEQATTSRELVAEVIADVALRDSLPNIQALAFIDGDEELSQVI
ncbi:NAD(P)H-binding protein [Corynebacterium lubricantis]|uniref:NAD(P)H-binding protein n=1 Tax=Corynebacterium lubricantis TaxID=541095 RepID=UPI000368C900|nr:NAD(P)H-binding protein [Corynebacterium lubricantis]